MSHDRNAGGLEKTVQRLNRVLFCRFFHSKLSPVGGLCPKGRTAGLHPSSRPKPDLETFQSQDTSGTTTFEKPALPSPKAAGCRGSNHIRAPSPSATQSEIRSSPVYAGREIKPLKKLAFRRGRLQSWTGSRSSGTPKDLCAHPSKATDFLILSSNPCGCPERNDLLSYRVFGMRAQTCQQRPARPETIV